MSKIEKLERIIWANGIPIILSTYAAYELTTYDHFFYMVTWWGDEPAAFSRFEFTGLVSGGYEIKLINEPHETMTALESDEWVVSLHHGAA